MGLSSLSESRLPGKGSLFSLAVSIFIVTVTVIPRKNESNSHLPGAGQTQGRSSLLPRPPTVLPPECLGHSAWEFTPSVRSVHFCSLRSETLRLSPPHAPPRTAVHNPNEDSNQNSSAIDHNSTSTVKPRSSHLPEDTLRHRDDYTFIKITQIKKIQADLYDFW